MPEPTLQKRVQHPKVHERKDRGTFYWFFRYRHDETRPDGSIRTRRKFHTLAPSRGAGAVGKRAAELQRDRFLGELHATPAPSASPLTATPAVDRGPLLFGLLAERWLHDYVNNSKIKLAEPTRQKYRSRLHSHVLGRWKDVGVAQMRAKDILDWLQAECTSWHMMIDLKNILSGIFRRAQEWEILEESFVNPLLRVKIGRKWMVRPERILTEQETGVVLARLPDPHRLICETCLSTGTRISEVVGLMRKHLDLRAGTIQIRQRHCRGDIDEPKTRNSKRTLTLGFLGKRYCAWIAQKQIHNPEDWLFAQEDRQKPMWDSGVRKALKIAARASGCDFPGFGFHSFRRANITWRQEVGASAIEASKIAGHASVSMTGDYTHVQLKRQEELTRAIQQRLRRSLRSRTRLT